MINIDKIKKLICIFSLLFFLFLNAYSISGSLSDSLSYNDSINETTSEYGHFCNCENIINEKISDYSSDTDKYNSTAKLAEIEQAIKESNLNWIPGYTYVTDHLSNNYRCSNGCNKEEEEQTATIIPINVPLPSSFDWRNHNGINWVTSVKNQLGCGACVAFSAIAAAETVTQIETGKIFNCDLSEAHLFFCGGGACENGWQMAKACSYLNEFGVPDDKCFEYSGTQTSCDETSPNWMNRRIQFADYGKITNNLEQIKNALIEYGPLIAHMDTYDDFDFYTGGIYEHVDPRPTGDHAILIVGFTDDDSVNTGGYWICKNSWGEYWGEPNPYDLESIGGWFRIKYYECKIGDNVYFLDGSYGEYQPSKPDKPYPSNNMRDVPINITLSWESFDINNDDLVFSVYFNEGTSVSYNDIYAENISDKSFVVSDLEKNTQYTWKVLARDTKGCVNEGNSWTFITILPSKPVLQGNTTGKPGDLLTFTGSGGDVGGEEYYWTFDFGDGTYSGWLGPYSSGEDVVVEHTWGEKGSYEVKTRYMIDKKISYWSDPLEISMPKSKLHLSFLKERFPFLFNLLSSLNN